MENQKKRIESERLVYAYRSWASHIKTTRPGSANIIFMDDLSDLAAGDSQAKGQLTDWVETFHHAIQLKEVFNPDELIKIRQSLEFSRFMDEIPTRKSVEACGGKFEDGRAVLIEIEDLTQQIEDMEALGLPEFPSTSETSYHFATKIAQKGFEFIDAQCSGFKPLDFNIGQLDPSSPFVAQVVTSEPGKIVCEIPFDRPINSAFAGLMIHEILGHVFHFSQLKGSACAEQAPHLLCLSLHTHEGFFIEAVSQLVTTYLSCNSSWKIPGKEQIALYDLKYRRTQAIAHYLITKMIDGDFSIKEAVQFHHQYSKGSMTIEFLEGRYKILTQNLFTMKSTLNYFPSFKAVKPMLELKEEKFFKSLKEMVNNYYTPESLEQFVLGQIE